MIKAQWHIIGAGAIGSWCAYALTQSALTPVLVFRDAHSAERFNRNGVLSIEINDTSVNIPVNATHWGNIKDNSIHNAIVATKSWQNAQALDSLLPKLAANATVVLMQNGYGQLQAAKAILTPFAYFAASTTNGGYKRDRHTLCLAGLGDTHIGAYNDKAITKSIQLPLARAHDNIESILWRKLCINAAINPLTAIYNVKNGELIHQESARKRIQSISEELAAISHAKGLFSLSSIDIESWIIDVCRITAKNSSSMREDSLNQRKTEIEEINGYLMQEAQQHGIAVPELTACWQAVKALEC